MASSAAIGDRAMRIRRFIGPLVLPMLGCVLFPGVARANARVLHVQAPDARLPEVARGAISSCHIRSDCRGIPFRRTPGDRRHTRKNTTSRSLHKLWWHSRRERSDRISQNGCPVVHHHTLAEPDKYLSYLSLQYCGLLLPEHVPLHSNRSPPEIS
jgi:hypothetical protein